MKKKDFAAQLKAHAETIRAIAQSPLHSVPEMGTRWRRRSDRLDVYLLAQVAPNQYNLIGLSTGNRYTDSHSSVGFTLEKIQQYILDGQWLPVQK